MAPVEELQVHALFVKNAALLPQSQQVLLLHRERDELLVDFGRGPVLFLNEQLSGIGCGAETVLSRIYLTLHRFKKWSCYIHFRKFS